MAAYYPGETAVGNAVVWLGVWVDHGVVMLFPKEQMGTPRIAMVNREAMYPKTNRSELYAPYLPTYLPTTTTTTNIPPPQLFKIANTFITEPTLTLTSLLGDVSNTLKKIPSPPNPSPNNA